MIWDLDVPNLPFKKPIQIEKLELMDKEQREAMDPEEVRRKTEEVAYSLALSFKKRIGNDKVGCLAMIQKAIEELGYSFGGKMGAAMLGHREQAARQACQDVFGKALI